MSETVTPLQRMQLRVVKLETEVMMLKARQEYDRNCIHELQRRDAEREAELADLMKTLRKQGAA